MIVIDADVLGRNRTGDETYVLNLLRAAAGASRPTCASPRSRAIPSSCPTGVEAIELPARSQELRMAWSLPRLLRRLRPELAHFQHALPLGWRGRSVVTLHDLSFEHDAGGDGPRSTASPSSAVVPRAARRADARARRLGAHEAPTSIALYGLAAGEDHRHAARRRSRVLAGRAVRTTAVPALRRRGPGAQGSARRARRPRDAVGLPLVVAGPGEGAGARARAARRAAPTCAATSRRRSSPSSTAARRRSSCRRASRASACRCSRRWPAARRSSPPTTPALREVGGDAVVYAERRRHAAAVRARSPTASGSCAAGLERAQRFTWAETARRTAEVYRQVLA